MTEAEWLACKDPAALIKALGRNPSKRKRRLFGCACCRRIWDLIPDEQGQAAVMAAEQFADGLIGEAELERHERAVKVARWKQSGTPYSAYIAAGAGACVTAKLAGEAVRAWWYSPAAKGRAKAEEKGTNPERPDFAGVVEEAEAEELSQLVAIFRDIFGNPFRPVMLDQEWRTSTAVALARQMYESRDFGAMPILADALQDAGCDSEDILNHCRGNGPHVRGCWVVDMVLGKS
jgi:hypothetical protein